MVNTVACIENRLRCFANKYFRPTTVLLLVAGMLVPTAHLSAHTPYGQWDTFRSRHLQVLTSRADLTGDQIGDTWVAVLSEHLPKSKAVVSRARTLGRLASILKTDQAKLAVLSHSDAIALSNGVEPFVDIGAVVVQLLVDNGSHVLVAREDLPSAHGYLITATLIEHAGVLNLSIPLESNRLEIGIHPGAAAVAAGKGVEILNSQ